MALKKRRGLPNVQSQCKSPSVSPVQAGHSMRRAVGEVSETYRSDARRSLSDSQVFFTAAGLSSYCESQFSPVLNTKSRILGNFVSLLAGASDSPPLGSPCRGAGISLAPIPPQSLVVCEALSFDDDMTFVSSSEPIERLPSLADWLPNLPSRCQHSFPLSS